MKHVLVVWHPICPKHSVEVLVVAIEVSDNADIKRKPAVLTSLDYHSKRIHALSQRLSERLRRATFPTWRLSHLYQ
jgi:hypothetical protein